MTDIKPIETFYNGYRFRSRLEARWAVFFDAANIPYQYEPEGFDLGQYGYYLPDFYLPWFDAYVEIKPKDSIHLSDAVQKLEALFNGTAHTVLLCVGDPADNDMRTYCNDITDSSAGGPNEWTAQFVEGAEVFDSNGNWSNGRHFIMLDIGLDNDRKDRGFRNSAWVPLKCAIPLRCVRWCRSFLDGEKRTARQARFEHGETPNIRR